MIPLSKQEYRAHLRRKRDEHVKNHSKNPFKNSFKNPWIAQETQQVLDNLVGAAIVSADAVIGSYWPIGSEVDSTILINRFFQDGHLCGLPFWIDNNQILEFRKWQPGQELIQKSYNILMPHQSCPLIVPTVLFVPLVGFDHTGNRLGQGAGHYDRTIKAMRNLKLGIAVGIAFDCQEVDNLPCEDYDEPMDFIITPTRIIDIKK
jgi:5-formyltetrahydrofolate cyclo-ligase